jgi:hypothetical protein
MASGDGLGEEVEALLVPLGEGEDEDDILKSEKIGGSLLRTETLE